jgi:hypothetical protein
MSAMRLSCTLPGWVSLRGYPEIHDPTFRESAVTRLSWNAGRPCDVSRRRIRGMLRIEIMAPLDAGVRSSSVRWRRERPCQALVRSTTQRCANGETPLAPAGCVLTARRQMGRCSFIHVGRAWW